MTKTNIFLIFCIFLCSCVSERRQKLRADIYVINHPEYIAKLCSDRFEAEPKYLEGKPLTVTLDHPEKVDSLLRTVDSIQLAVLNGKQINFDSLRAEILKRCKPIEVRTTRVDTIREPDLAKIDLKNREIAKLEKVNRDQGEDLKAMKESRDNFRAKYVKLVSILVGIGVIALVVVFFRFKTSILGAGASVLKIFKSG